MCKCAGEIAACKQNGHKATTRLWSLLWEKCVFVPCVCMRVPRFRDPDRNWPRVYGSQSETFARVRASVMIVSPLNFLIRPETIKPDFYYIN